MLYSEWNFTEVSSWCPNWQLIIFGLGDGLLPNWYQAITSSKSGDVIFTTFGSSNGLMPNQHQALTCYND